MKPVKLAKKVLNNLSPPLFPKLYQKYKFYRSGAVDFKEWWSAFKSQNRDLPSDLICMVDYFVDSPAYSASSKYWNYLNRINIQQISAGGYKDFKQTVARNYFTFVGGGLETPYIKNLLSKSEGQAHPWPGAAILKKHSHFSLDESVAFNIITCLLYDFVKRNDPAGLLEKMDEPMEGNPPAISLDNKNVSQDFLNANLEINAILKGVDLASAKRVIEVGAGSGRTSYNILKLFPSLKYVVVDIPPALYISQTYLCSQFKNQKIFKFRPMEDAQDFVRELMDSDLCFITPDQLKLLPEKCADVFLAIDCLHEMKREQVDTFFSEADRLANSIYYKCWNETVVPHDNIKYGASDYPVRPNWKQKFEAQCQVPATFFEAFYEIR